MILLLESGLDLLAEDRLVEQVLNPQTDPIDLVRVRRTDAASRCTDPRLAKETLCDFVDHLVVRGDDVRARRNDHVRSVHTTRRKPFDLGEQHIEINNDSVADHRDALGIEDARRQEVQGVALAVNYDCMTGVVAA